MGQRIQFSGRQEILYNYRILSEPLAIYYTPGKGVYIGEASHFRENTDGILDWLQKSICGRLTDFISVLIPEEQRELLELEVVQQQILCLLKHRFKRVLR